MTTGPTLKQQRAKLAAEYRAEKRNPRLTPSVTFTNSTQPSGSLKGKALPVMGTSRDGANDFQLINSVSIGAQIRRNP